jgi:hypothetical protein
MYQRDREEFSKMGFNLDEDPVISFIYRIKVVARRISFFQNLFKKWAKEDGIENLVEPEEESVHYKGIDFIRLVFTFKDCKTTEIVKTIIVVNDVLRFITSLFGYTTDNKEVFVAEFIPGSKVKIINRIDDGYFTVTGYEFDREKKALKFKVNKGDENLVLPVHYLLN